MWFSFLCQDLNLLDKNLTPARLMGIIAAERLDPTNLTSCLDEEVLVCLQPAVCSCCYPCLPGYLRWITYCALDYIPGIFRSAIRMC